MIFSKAERPNIIAKHPEFASKASSPRREGLGAAPPPSARACAARPLTRAPPSPRPLPRAPPRAPARPRRAQVTEVAKLLGAKWKSMSDA